MNARERSAINGIWKQSQLDNGTYQIRCSRTQKTTWVSFKNSSYQHCNRMLTFKTITSEICLALKCYLHKHYENLRKHQHTEESKSEWCAVTQSQKHVVQEKVLFLSSEHFILTQRQREDICNNWQKYYVLQFQMHQKRRISVLSQSQFGTYSIGGLNWWMKTA